MKLKLKYEVTMLIFQFKCDAPSFSFGAVPNVVVI